MRYLFFLVVLVSSVSFAQKAKEKVKVNKVEKQIIRDGNDLYKQNNYTDAEVQYKKALEVNPNYEKANYNLGNAIYQQNRFKEALPMYDLVTKTSDNKLTKAENFHNMGNVFMKSKEYAKAVEAYKNSLRNNSKDDETRYNLALAQKLLKNQADNKEKDKNNKDKNNDKKDQKKENKDQNKDKKDQNKDKKEGDKGDKDKDKKGDNKNDQNKDKQGENEKKKKNPQPKKNQLSKEQIKQLLEAMNNEENKTQKKVNAKKARGRKVKQAKDW